MAKKKSEVLTVRALQKGYAPRKPGETCDQIEPGEVFEVLPDAVSDWMEVVEASTPKTVAKEAPVLFKNPPKLEAPLSPPDSEDPESGL